MEGSDDLHNQLHINLKGMYRGGIRIWVLLVLAFIMVISVSGSMVRASAAESVDIVPPPVFAPPPSTEGGEPFSPPLHAQVLEYKVMRGDTLSDIASAFSTDPDSLAVINEMTNWDRLQPGEMITVLTVSGLLRRVAPGDSAEEIAEKYSISLDDLMAANSLRPGDEMPVGANLILPHARPPRDAVLAARGELYLWPVQGRITSHYGARWGSFHHGIDIGVPYGTSIRASRSGTVTFAGWRGNYGILVIVDHGGGAATWYAHLSRTAVSSGQWVERGQVLGYVGTTGRSTGPHLHFEVRINGESRNPLNYLP